MAEHLDEAISTPLTWYVRPNMYNLKLRYIQREPTHIERMFVCAAWTNPRLGPTGFPTRFSLRR
jgi:hypothetical protein